MDAEFGSRHQPIPLQAKKKATRPAGDAGKVALRPRKPYRRTRVRSVPGIIIDTLACSSPWDIASGLFPASPCANCAASVEPASAVVEEFPLAITCVTISKYPVPTKR